MKLGPRVRCDEQRILELAAAGLTNAQVVAELGICDRTFTRWRVSHPALSQQIISIRAHLAAAAIPACGTLPGYRRHLRLHEQTDHACRDANTRYGRKQDARRRERLGLPPANPRRGRPRRELRGGADRSATTADLVEQAIARGQTTSWIMNAHGVDYAAVQAVRADLDAAAVA